MVLSKVHVIVLFFAFLRICYGKTYFYHVHKDIVEDTNKIEVSEAPSNVKINITKNYVILDNGILQVTLLKPTGYVTEIKYKGVDNLLEVENKETNRGYWDLTWNPKGEKGKRIGLPATDFEVIDQNEDQIELSFKITWDISLSGKTPPLNVDKRFVMLSGSSGFYTYTIFEHLKDWPAFDIGNLRMTFKLNKKEFHYMAVAENRQRDMPLPDDRLPPRGRVLDYKEAVKLINPIESEFKGEVDDKYLYSCESQVTKVHGWISNQSNVGLWQITPSYEDRSGGPFKQYLYSHVGPTSLNVFHSSHYVGENITLRFENGEAWKKTYGPIFVYANSISKGIEPKNLWLDAQKQATTQSLKWPYKFLASKDFPKEGERGAITGRLFVQDRYIKKENIIAKGAYVGLAAPGDIGSWQTEGKNYQFWTQTDEEGHFIINHVRPGIYNIYAFVPGFIGDYHYNSSIITITSGKNINVNDLLFKPPRHGPTLWEIGIPDRTANEFFIPKPNPDYVNRLYLNHPDRFRQYGLWEEYSELYPNHDLSYNVDSDNYKKDWFFAQVTRKQTNNTYKGTTWSVIFKLDNVTTNGIYKLQLALATAHYAILEVRVNDPKSECIVFSTGTIGKDNAIARHGIHGLYRLFSADIMGNNLREGNNSIFLSQTGSTSPFQGLMYDYIRLEGPPSN